LLDSKDISHLKDHQLAMIRSESIGFVFQTFNLLARTSALNNVMLPLLYAGIGRAERRDRARRALEIVGLADRMSHMPTELSGGQQQRVAIARALVNNPAIILADEPTGNLDSRSGQEIMAVMQTLNRERGITLVLVTHDATLAQHSQRIVYLHDGLITQDQIVDQPLVAAPSV
jgi:putative ABC transport system ATP-binding protein